MKPTNDNRVKIFNDKKNHKFYCIVEGHECVAEYRIIGNTIDFYHTFVNQSLRGRGIAGMLYDAALRFVIEKNLKVLPTCSYARKYFEENRKDLIL